MKKKLYKDHGKVFWITGLSGSGKSVIGENLLPMIEKKYGKTILIHGDNIRAIYKINSYKKSERLALAKSNSDLCSFLTKQGVNVIFTTVALIHNLHKYNRKNIKFYIEIFIKSDIQKLVQRKNKYFYRKKNKNVWGLDLKPQYPKKPEIIIENNFHKSTHELAKIIFKKIKNNNY
jgi:adenylylsulfate kinase